MVITKSKYQSPTLKVFGSARDVMLSDASPLLRQAVRAMAEDAHKVSRHRSA